MMLRTLYLLLFIWTVDYYGVSAQVLIPNADFEMPENTVPTGSGYWRTEGNPEHCLAEKANAYQGKYSMHLIKSNSQGTARFYQEIPLQVLRLRKYSISAAIKVKNISDGYAGVSVRVIDSAGRLICHQNLNMMPVKINNTQEWKVYEGEFYATPATAKIKIAGYLWGSGEAWYDNIRIREIAFPEGELTPHIAAYIDEYFSFIRTKSIVKDTACIALLRNNARQMCHGNPDIHYCHFVLKNITFNLNDGHSFFSTPEEWKEMHRGENNVQRGEAGFASGKMLNGNIACINIPTFASVDRTLVKQAADSLQQIIKALDHQSPAGWIIDLSNCTGGNSFAMFPGLGPLLGNGICGYSVSADGSRLALVYRDGRAGWDTHLDTLVTAPYSVIHPELPIAVLYGARTGSSGEVTALALRGKKNTKSFGQETGGYTTRVDNYVLSDGASLNLASGYDADRNGVVFYGTKIPPDVTTKDRDEAMEKAMEWLIKWEQ